MKYGYQFFKTKLKKIIKAGEILKIKKRKKKKGERCWSPNVPALDVAFMHLCSRPPVRAVMIQQIEC